MPFVKMCNCENCGNPTAEAEAEMDNVWVGMGEIATCCPKCVKSFMAVGYIGTREKPESESCLKNGILCCVGCYEDDPGAFWFWSPVRQSEHADRSCERCGKKLVEKKLSIDSQ